MIDYIDRSKLPRRPRLPLLTVQLKAIKVSFHKIYDKNYIMCIIFTISTNSFPHSRKTDVFVSNRNMYNQMIE